MTMRTITMLATALCVLPGAARAQDEALRFTTQPGNLTRVLYELELKGRVGDRVVIRVPRHQLPSGAERLTGKDCEPPATEGGPAIEGDWFVWKCTLVAVSAPVTFAVSGPTDGTEVGTGGTVKVSIAGVEKDYKNRNVLKSADHAFVQAVLGGGGARLGDDFEEFAIKNNRLVLINDSQYRPTALAGALIRLGDLWGRQASIHTAFQFTQGGPSFLDGVSLGLAYEVNRLAHLSAGVALRKGKELSPGFLRTAANTIGGATSGSPFAVFKDYDPSSKDRSPLDGLPLFTDSDNKVPLYGGDVIVDSYNWSLYFGVAVPVRISEIFGGKSPAKD